MHENPLLTPFDLEPFADIDTVKASSMIDDAMALATQIAPCIVEDGFAHRAAAKAIIRGAVLRWNDAGTGAVSQQTAGPFSQTVDTRQQRRQMFWPSEIVQLQKLCADAASGGAFSVDMAAGAPAVRHAETCSLVFGADYCDCGANIAGYPLYGP